MKCIICKSNITHQINHVLRACLSYPISNKGYVCEICFNIYVLKARIILKDNEIQYWKQLNINDRINFINNFNK